jgi:DNA-binding transcriptional ArsR family regulator
VRSRPNSPGNKRVSRLFPGTIDGAKRRYLLGSYPFVGCDGKLEDFDGLKKITLHIPIWVCIVAAVPRAATTSDAFNAVAEPRRRDILNYLALQECPVGEIVATLGLEQPSVSKHLRVLRDVGLVHVRRDGRRMLYRTNAEAIRPLHEWASTFERFWQNQLRRVKERAEGRVGRVQSDVNSRRNHDFDRSKD